jgi:ATP-binding cassette subfamily E protein 1
LHLSIFVLVLCNIYIKLCYSLCLTYYDAWFQATIKPQYIDNIRKSVKGKVGDYLSKEDQRQVKDTLCDILELNQILDRDVSDLSGGELQRFAIAARAMKEADVYIFDEPSCYLDVKQRLKAAQVIRSLLQPKK